MTSSLRILIPVVLASVAACSQNEDTAKANAAAAAQVAPASGQAMRQLRPLTDMEIAKDAYAKMDFPKALDHFKAAATAGDADAQFYTGLMYAQAEGVAKKNIPEAVRWYEKAVARDQPDAMIALARMYLVGFGVERNVDKAMELFNKAVEKYPPGEARDTAVKQRDAIAAVLDEQAKTAQAGPPPPPKQ
jgi:TPR repeat protein